MMLSFRAAWLCPFAVCAALAQVNTVRVSDEIAPPGGVAQMKVMLTSPQPISTGRLRASFPLASKISGIALPSGSGDVSGAAVISGSTATIHFTSTKGTLGTNVDYPILTVALQVPLDALPGQVATVSLDGAESWLADLLGRKITLELKPGSLTVGGNLSITDVLPGGGSLPAGATVRVLGMGFTPQTRIRFKELENATAVFVNTNEIAVRLNSPAVLDGTQIVVRNPDGSSISYFSYLRGIPVGQSARPLLAVTEPVFSTSTLTEGILPATVSPLNSAYFTGMAFQNPGAVTAIVTMEQYVGKQVTGHVSFALTPRHRISRTVSEWLGAASPTGTYWHIVSSVPVQMMGLLGNDQNAAVLPLSVVPVKPSSFQP